MSTRIQSHAAIEAMMPEIHQVAGDLARAHASASRAIEEEHNSREVVDQRLDELQRVANELEQLGGTVRTYDPLQMEFVVQLDGEIGFVRFEHGALEATPFRSAYGSVGVPA